jgi:hypothetical protein
MVGFRRSGRRCQRGGPLLFAPQAVRPGRHRADRRQRAGRARRSPISTRATGGTSMPTNLS